MNPKREATFEKGKNMKNTLTRRIGTKVALALALGILAAGATPAATAEETVGQTPPEEKPAATVPAPSAETKMPSGDTREGQAMTSRPKEPYPARPTGDPPAGWKITLLENSKVESVTPVAPGKDIKISVAAYKLEPDGAAGSFVVKDPSYNPLLKNDQKRTIGATITRYSEEVVELQNDLKEVMGALEIALKKAPEPPKKVVPAATPAETKQKEKKKS